MSSERLFQLVLDPSQLLPILRERLPISCMMYNQVLLSPSFHQDLKFYTIGTQITSNTWILSNNVRQDFRFNFLISAPNSVVYGEVPIPHEVRECFSTGGGVIDWEDTETPPFFPPSPKIVSSLISDITVNEKGLLTEIHPCYLYYMEPEEALQVEISPPDEVVVRRLESANNEADFITKNWKYSLPGTELELQKCIDNTASAGVFVKGECASAVCISGIGFLTGLYTLQEHRNKGFAKLAVKYATKEFAKDGFIPCLTVEIPNKPSVVFHEKLGFRKAAQVNGIMLKKLNLD